MKNKRRRMLRLQLLNFKPVTITPRLIFKSVLFIGLVLVLFKILVPWVLGLFYFFIGLVLMWGKLIDINFKFIGAVFFFIVSWEILKALIMVFYQLFNYIFELKIKQGDADDK